MRAIKTLISLAVIGLLPLAASPVGAADTPPQYPHIVDGKFVADYAVIPKRNDVVIVDARPTARKYDLGHLPGAISIPDRKFDELAKMLPEDKSTLLIFYCGGLKCPLSHKSAFKAEALGYTNAKVYAAGYPDWIEAGNLAEVSAAYVKKLIDTNAKVAIIDSRPKARKYDKGHVPTAISIPDRKFDDFANLLPDDKATPLIFYCGGYGCKLSPNSAAEAKALGYTKISVFQAGYPEWKAAYGPGETAADDSSAGATPKIVAGPASDTITVESFERIVREAPDSILMIDVRDPEEVAAGSFKTAVFMTVDEVEEKVDEIPVDKPVVFVCSTGTRSAEAYDIFKMAREDGTVYFLDAEVTHNADGTQTIVANAQ